MKELTVSPCANGRLAKAAYDKSDNTIILFDQFGHMALGYIELDEIWNNENDMNPTEERMKI